MTKRLLFILAFLPVCALAVDAQETLIEPAHLLILVDAQDAGAKAFASLAKNGAGGAVVQGEDAAEALAGATAAQRAGLAQVFPAVPLPEARYFTTDEASEEFSAAWQRLARECGAREFAGLALSPQPSDLFYFHAWDGYGDSLSPEQLDENARRFGWRLGRSLGEEAPGAHLLMLFPRSDAAGPLFWKMVEGLLTGIAVSGAGELHIACGESRLLDSPALLQRYIANVDAFMKASLPEVGARRWRDHGAAAACLTLEQAQKIELLLAARLHSPRFCIVAGAELSEIAGAAPLSIAQRLGPADPDEPPTFARPRIRADLLNQAARLGPTGPGEAPYVLREEAGAAVVFWKGVPSEAETGRTAAVFSEGEVRTNLPMSRWGLPAMIRIEGGVDAGRAPTPLQARFTNQTGFPIKGVLTFAAPPRLRAAPGAFDVELQAGETFHTELRLTGLRHAGEPVDLEAAFTPEGGVPHKKVVRLSVEPEEIWRMNVSGYVSGVTAVPSSKGPLLFAVSTAGEVLALDAKGKLIRRTSVEGAIQNAPVVIYDEKTVSVLCVSEDGTAHGFSPAGDKRWTQSLGGLPSGQPVAFRPSDAESLWAAIALTSGEVAAIDAVGAVRWRAKVGRSAQIHLACDQLTGAGGEEIVAAGENVLAVLSGDGRHMWSAQTVLSASCPPAVAGRASRPLLLLGDSDGNIEMRDALTASTVAASFLPSSGPVTDLLVDRPRVFEGGQVIACAPGAVHALGFDLQPQQHAPVWGTPLAAVMPLAEPPEAPRPYGLPAGVVTRTPSPRIYAASSHGQAICFGANGERQWEAGQVFGPPGCRPLPLSYLRPETLLVSTVPGRLQALLLE
jgi:hypothetical protein